MAVKLIATGMSVDEIATLTGLTSKEIDCLK